MRDEWKTLKNVAWLRVGALGDLLVGLASLAEMHDSFPQASITVVGPALWTQVLSPEQLPFVKRIIAVERKQTTARIFEAVGSSWKEVSEAMPLYRALKGYDGFVNTNIDSTRYGFTALRAGIGVRVGSVPPAMAWLYTDASPYFGKDPLIHEKNTPLLLLEFARTGWKRFASSVAQNREQLSKYLQQSRLVEKWKSIGLPSARKFDLSRITELTGRAAGRYVLVNPTASRREKTWPTAKLRELLRETAAELQARDLAPIVIGAPNETAWLEEVAEKNYRIVQPRSLADLQDIVYGAKMLLTNGSSMQFIAGSTQTPTLTVFGRGQPVIWGPVGPQDRIVRAKFEGAEAGSTFAGFEEEARIYETIPVEEVKQVFLSLLALPGAKLNHSREP